MQGRMFVLLFSIVSLSIQAQQTDDSLMIRRIADEILVNGQAHENLRQLTKQVGGRLSGSPQMYKAEAWGRKAMEQAGADKVWLQECKVTHWTRGSKEEAYIISGDKQKQVLDILALGNSVGTGAAGVRAQVILINSFEELEQHKDDVKGKIVFYNYKFNDRFIETFNSYIDAVRYRVEGPSRAAKYGAVAVIVRSITSSTDNNPHTGATDYIDSFPKIPAVAVGLKDAVKLAERAAKGQVNVYLRSNAMMHPDTVGHNVIGELTGSESPNEFITVGGHLDSWDPAEGAHDDGAGCVHTIEVLRALKAIGYKPKKTIRFVLFANEENGLGGGTKYAEEAKAKNEKHVFALETDEGGFTPRGFGFDVSLLQMQKLQTWQPLFAPYLGCEFSTGSGGADIGPLNTLLSTPMAGLRPDSQRYFDVHHSRGDVFEAVNKRELELGAVNIAALIYMIDKYGL
jgi:carboxypeptidase Q